jgi:hypothetical protein
MEEFESLTTLQLRKLLVDTMIEKRGRDHALLWYGFLLHMNMEVV